METRAEKKANNRPTMPLGKKAKAKAKKAKKAKAKQAKAAAAAAAAGGVVGEKNRSKAALAELMLGSGAPVRRATPSATSHAHKLHVQLHNLCRSIQQQSTLMRSGVKVSDVPPSQQS